MSRRDSAYILALTGVIALVVSLVVDTRAEHVMREARNLLARAEHLTRRMELSMPSPCLADDVDVTPERKHEVP